MNRWTVAAFVSLSLSLSVPIHGAADEAVLFRVFLRDGTSLVSYGEWAQVGDRLVFSLPTAAVPDPPLQLVTVGAHHVDWERTNRYAESARAARYIATQAESDYAALSEVLAGTLNAVAFEVDAVKRVALVEKARKTLAEWPRHHFNYRHDDVRQMVSMLDEAIADLRAAAGSERFDISLVALVEPPASPGRLLPPPTPVEAIEKMLTVARLTESAPEREALLTAVLVALDRDRALLPADWAAALRAETTAAVAEDRRLARSYRLTTRRLIAQADRRARLADVRGVMQSIDRLRQYDAALGHKRPDIVTGALAALEAHLDAARQLRLARDRWAMRAAILREYGKAISTPLGILRSVEAPLRDIKELAGSSQGALTLVREQVKSLVLLVTAIVPPEECRAAHALIASAAHLAGRAADIRTEATLSGDIGRAWDASAAASGALMLGARAEAEIQTLLRPPRLP